MTVIALDQNIALEREFFLDLKQGREVHTLEDGFQTREMRTISTQDQYKQVPQQLYVVFSI